MEKFNTKEPAFITSRGCEESLFSDRKGLPTSCDGGVKTKKSATESASSSWLLNWNDGDTNNNNKNNNNQVRPICASLQETVETCPDYLFASPIRLEDVIAAYLDCRKNKRNTVSAMAFEVNYEANCVELCEEINNRTYHPQRSITFIITRPVKREIFAASFRDRIIHHLLINRINPLLEELFIDETSNCRKGKGTHFGIRTLEDHIRQCSANYTKDCWALKLDIRSFFMSIPRSQLCDMLASFITERYTGADRDTLIYLMRETILNEPERNCIRKSHPDAWAELPVGKSLFTSPAGHGIPIGNLTSQVSANFFLNAFDHLMKYRFTFYGRYVDDFYIISTNREALKQAVADIRNYLHTLGLTLHPDKIYLQHVSKGVKYIGAVVKPGRTYVANRSRNSFYARIDELNQLAAADKGYVYEQAEYFASCMNSYFGMMSHFSTYGIRRKAARRISPLWWKVCYISGHFEKISVKNKYKKNRILKKKLLKGINVWN